MPVNLRALPPWRIQDNGATTVDIQVWAHLPLRPTLKVKLAGRSTDSQNRGNGSKRPTSRGARRHDHPGRRHRPDFRRRRRIRRGLPGLHRRLLWAVEPHSPRDFDP